jgi:hypothetical protein
MSKVSREYLPNPNEQKLEDLKQQYYAKDDALQEALKMRDFDLVDQIQEEKLNLLTELRMINPNIELTIEEDLIKSAAELETKQHHEELNRKRREN